MTTAMGIDIGYRQVKAVKGSKQIVFPSSVAPAKTFAVESIGKIEEFLVKIKPEFENEMKEYFVGDLAEREALSSVISQSDRVKHLDATHDVLVMTAARLLLTDSMPDVVVVGLPISYYRSQKVDLEAKIKSLNHRVSVDKQKATLINFNKVVVFPQGSGALMTIDDLRQNGTVCLIDIGMKTTDCVVVRMENAKMMPVASLCVSVELGVKDFYDSVGHYYEVKTGSAPNFLRVLEVVERNGKVMFDRADIDLSHEIKLARAEIQHSIVDRVKNALAEVWSELDEVYLAGGGADVFYTIDETMGARKIKEPVWANARGFAKIGQAQVV